MPEAVSQAFQYMADEGRNAAPKTDDILRLTGRETTIGEFLERHL